ncbi:hypothetical protein ATANTOWER_015229 [Ataeniobius toweri]|uniref:Uncharacterized protein n=1 Tax=Ataeniobius toweri TaxID=208326 RepID=A0ABU7B9J1_9TELE|nr:hypothetical protein [Ataeniobius toweri]
MPKLQSKTKEKLNQTHTDTRSISKGSPEVKQAELQQLCQIQTRRKKTEGKKDSGTNVDLSGIQVDTPEWVWMSEDREGRRLEAEKRCRPTGCLFTNTEDIQVLRPPRNLLAQTPYRGRDRGQVIFSTS